MMMNQDTSEKVAMITRTILVSGLAESTSSSED
jgi:hypothetical protein